MYKKNKTVVKYSLSDNNKSIFASVYKIHLPTKQELIDEIEKKGNIELNSDKN